MKSRIDIGLVQISTVSEPEENLKKLESAVERMVRDPDIIVTPEYFTGLEDGEPKEGLVRENAVSLDSEFVERIKERAREFESAMLFTVYLQEDNLYNASIFIDSSGEIKGTYRKTHLFDAFDHLESELFSPGEEIVVLDWKDYKIGLATCFDLRFPELFRIMSYKEADLVLVPSGFYSGEHKAEQWRTLINSRAHENNFFVVAVNQPKPHFVGESMISSPLGYEVERLGAHDDVRAVEIDLEEVTRSKENIPINQLSRPNFYRRYEPYY